MAPIGGGRCSVSPDVVAGGGMKRSGVRARDGTVNKGGGGAKDELGSACAVSSAQDVYSAVTTALSQALVHCKRFEVCLEMRKIKKHRRFYDGKSC